jgi:transcriptional regulator of acetoin/glycerol metabolism
VWGRGSARPGARNAAPLPADGAAPPGAPALGGAEDTRSDAASLRAALEDHRWSRVDTARALGMSRSTLWRRMRAAGLA